MSTSAPIQVDGVSVVLGDTLVLDEVDLLVEDGQSVALLGANGSGKSTLVRTILGLLPLSRGTVRLFGSDVTSRRSVSWERVGYVPQRIGSASGVPATALEVVRSGLLGPRRPLADRGRRAREAAMSALDVVGLAHRANEHVQIFSGGQMQRVLIARALVRAAGVYIFADSFSALDYATDARLRAGLPAATEGATLIVVAQRVASIRDAQQIVVLDEGRVVGTGTHKELMSDCPTYAEIVLSQISEQEAA